MDDRRKTQHRKYEDLAHREVHGKRHEPPKSEKRKSGVDRAKIKSSVRNRIKETVSAPLFSELSADKALRRDDAGKAKLVAPRYYGLDIPFLIVSMVLLAVGLIMMYSASYAWAIYKEGDPGYYINRQIIFAVAGIAVMALIIFFDYRIMKYLFLPYILVVFVLLIMVMLVGLEGGGAQRWISAGAFTLQPSEFAKLGVIWGLALVYDYAGTRVRKFWWGIIPLIIFVGSVDIFLVFQKHISALLLVTLSGAAIAFFAGVDWRWLAGFGALGAGGVSLIVAFSERFDYIRARLAIFVDPFSDMLDTGFQTVQSIYAVASGGLFGVGLGQSRQKQLFLPETQNDYVFAIVCEELGLVGALMILGLFIAFIICGFRIAFRVRDTFGKLLVAGIMTLLAMQILLNIMVVINAFPVTGVSLPFFSYGGTSLVLLMIEVGIVLCVSRQAEKTY
ncbi:MAG: FtsW/RodA/SpoVE family cell cycle protein [Clostridia bacterium]|nr:FtsW/RodA/SpoVE family cell cycle protein [Clostridia bacterium]